MEQENHIPSIEECEQLITRTDRNLILCELALIGLLAFMFLTLFLGLILNALWEWLLIALFLWFFIYFLLYLDSTKSKVPKEVPSYWRPVNEEKAPAELGNYSKEELLGLFEELKGRMKISSPEDTRLFVVDFFKPNAEAHRITRDICIDRSWLRMLDSRELKALMAHELMHLNYHGRWPALDKERFREAWALEIAVILLLPLLVASRMWLLVVPFILAQGIHVFNHTIRKDWVKNAKRYKEWLCDWAAAVHVSPSAAINIELKIGHRADLNKKVWNYLNAALKPYIISRSDLNVLVTLIDIKLDRTLLSKDELKARVEELAQELATTLCWELKTDTPGPEKTEPEEKEKDPHKLDWLRYDDNIRDLSLDEQELERLMADLKADSKAVLFTTDPDDKTVQGQTHPSSKQRVLFLYENWKQRSGKASKPEQKCPNHSSMDQEHVSPP